MAVPAEAFPVWEYVQENLESLGWSLDGLAERMEGDPVVNRASLDLLATQPSDPRIRLGSLAEGLATAFGTSVAVWRNLEQSWLSHPSTQSLLDAKPRGVQP